MMLNKVIALKDSILKQFGTVLGWIIIVLGSLLALTIVGFLIRVFFKLAIGLAVAALVLFGAYKAYEAISAKNNNNGN